MEQLLANRANLHDLVSKKCPSVAQIDLFWHNSHNHQNSANSLRPGKISDSQGFVERGTVDFLKPWVVGSIPTVLTIKCSGELGDVGPTEFHADHPGRLGLLLSQVQFDLVEVDSDHESPGPTRRASSKATSPLPQSMSRQRMPDPMFQLPLIRHGRNISEHWTRPVGSPREPNGARGPNARAFPYFAWRLWTSNACS